MSQKTLKKTTDIGQHHKTEAQEQCDLIEWANASASAGIRPELALLYAIPNGGRRDRAEAAHLKRQGVKAGVPDLCLPVPRGGFHGLYIEMKVDKNKPTGKQENWLRQLKNNGYATAVCYGAIGARKRIEWYLSLNGKEEII